MKLDADAFLSKSLAAMPPKQAAAALGALHVMAERERDLERARWTDAFAMRVGVLVPAAEPQQVSARAARLFDRIGYMDPARAALAESQGRLPAD